MRGKTLLHVTLPATGRGHDFWVPDDMRMHDAAYLICQAVQSVEPDAFLYTGEQTLMYEPTGQIQQPAATVGQIGFADGDRFVIV